MCSRCDKLVIKEMGVRDSDLPNLPFKWVKWLCIVPDCKGGCRVKDYGVPGYYFDPCKRRTTTHGWRGGWFANTHRYACGRHFKMIKARQMEFPESSPEIAVSKFVPIEVKKKA